MDNIKSSSTLGEAPAGEQVYALLHKAIVGLEMLPGQKISENALSAQMSVSRTPIREALQRLERQGLIFVLPQRGTFVAPLNLQAIRSAYFTRLALEKVVATEACRLRSERDLARLKGAIAEQEAVLASSQREDFFDLNAAFHRQLVEISDLTGMESVLESARNHLNRVRLAHLDYAGPYPLAPIIDEHKAIVAAIAAQDAAAAETEMHRHIEKVLPRYDLLLAKRPEFFELPGEISGPPGKRRSPAFHN
jgi:DNA-binding GntR family transcriptional regulator